MNNAIITGGTSFISIALAKHLASKGTKVHLIIRPNSSGIKSLPIHKNIIVYQENLSKLNNLHLSEEKIDVFFHIGWSSDYSNPRYNLEGQRNNIVYSENAMRLAEQYHCRAFLGMGSQAECGLVNGCITPQTPANPITAYAQAKIETYERLKVISNNNGIQLFWPRLLSVYGPYDRPHTLIMACIRSALMDQEIELTEGAQIWDYVYVDDVANALCLIAENGQPLTHYPIGSGKAQSLRSYIEKIARITESKHLTEGIGKKAYSENQVMNLLADINELTKDTGFAPMVDFDTGISRTIEYMKAIIK